MATVFGRSETPRRRKVTRLVSSDIVRLFSGRLAESDRQRILDVRQNSRDYDQDFLDTVEALADMEVLAKDADILAVMDKYQSEPTELRRIALKPILAIAATVLLAVTVVFISPFQADQRDGIASRYSTRIGEQKTITLEDGSLIALNTGTQLWVELSDGRRRVVLERGEAWFDVAADPSRPFTIDLGMRSVSVLGTKFNILKSPGQFTLAVVEGMVAIHRDEETVSSSAPAAEVATGDRVQLRAGIQHRIPAGMATEFDASSQQLVAWRPSHIDRVGQWRSGVIRYDEEPLSKVIQELNRYSAKKILIEDSAIMDMEVYAAIRIDRIDMALSVLENSLPVKVTQHFDRIVISAR